MAILACSIPVVPSLAKVPRFKELSAKVSVVQCRLVEIGFNPEMFSASDEETENVAGMEEARQKFQPPGRYQGDPARLPPRCSKRLGNSVFSPGSRIRW